MIEFTDENGRIHDVKCRGIRVRCLEWRVQRSSRGNLLWRETRDERIATYARARYDSDFICRILTNGKSGSKLW